MKMSEHEQARDVRGGARDGRRRARRVCAVAAMALSLFVACASDPQEEAREESQRLASWAATLHLLADSWRAGAVPTRYTRKSAEAAHETLQEELKSMQKSSTLPSDARASLVERAQSLDALASAVAQAAQKEDRNGAEQLGESLAREEQTLKELAQQAGAQGR